MIKPLESLTRLGQVRRLRRLALHALEYYDLEVSRIELLGWFTNLLFRVRTSDGTSYVLRLCNPGWRTEEDIHSEVVWLKAIASETELPVPCPIPARNGELVINAPIEGIPNFGRCVMMSWIPGIPLGKRLTRANLYKMGILFAQLHAYSTRFKPSPDFTQRKMSHYLARDEQNVLFQAECLDKISPQAKEILLETNKRVEDAFLQLYANPSGLRVIHNDLWHGNIKIHHGKLYPLDFEDTIWGYPVQDIAMALQDLMSDVAPEAFEPLQEAFYRGYTSLSPWPESYTGQIDIFRAGRVLWVANFVACYQSQYLTTHISGLTPMLENFLNTGLVRKVYQQTS